MSHFQPCLCLPDSSFLLAQAVGDMDQAVRFCHPLGAPGSVLTSPPQGFLQPYCLSRHSAASCSLTVQLRLHLPHGNRDPAGLLAWRCCPP